MKVYLSATLRSFFGRNAVLSVSADSVRQLLEKLTEDYPEAKKILFDESESLRSYHRCRL